MLSTATATTSTTTTKQRQQCYLQRVVIAVAFSVFGTVAAAVGCWLLAVVAVVVVAVVVVVVVVHSVDVVVDVCS